MEKIVDQYIIKNHLFTKEDHLLLAISGGVDSIVLFDILIKLQYKFSVVNCNFQLRDIDSDLDSLLVQNICKQYSIQYYEKKFDTINLKEEAKKGIQEIARELRYNYFQELAIEHNLNYIVTAHHLNDSIETIIFNLIKGTTIHGLHGIAPKNNNIVRPLLCINKNEILKYAKIHNLKWREDISNLSEKYSRNLIRNKVIPILKKINPSIEKTFEKNIEKFLQIEELFIENIKRKKVENFIEISENKYQIKFGLLAVELFEYLNIYGFSYDTCQKIQKYKDLKTGAKFDSNHNYTIYKEADYLILEKNEKDFDEIIIETIEENIQKIISFKTINQLPVTFNKNEAFFSFQDIKFPLKIRNWKNSDKFKPFGMDNKTKLVSDYLTDLKISNSLKKNIKVLCNNENEIIWVIGYRQSNNYKINDNEKILRITKLFN